MKIFELELDLAKLRLELGKKDAERRARAADELLTKHMSTRRRCGGKRMNICQHRAVMKRINVVFLTQHCRMPPSTKMTLMS